MTEMLRAACIAISIVLGCAACLDPAAPRCPPGLQEWGYSRADSTGQEIFHAAGCAMPAAIDSLMASCMAGHCSALR